jgi:ElaB/YqjD/DUF883 family membrane-anchored ribosome-binding protein
MSDRDENKNEDVHEKRDELLEAVRRRGRGLLDKQKSSAAEELTSFADVMHDAAKKFDEKDEANVGGYVQKAADYVQKLSSTLRDKNPREMLHEGERLIRLKPAIALGASALVGFAIGRLLRASGSKIAEETKPGPSADLNIGAEGQIQP